MQDVKAQKESICEIGRRLYTKGFAAANEGNLSIRIGDDRVLCTPTMQCKGFMKPADICTVDMTGKQLEGVKKRTSEVLLHLEIYKRRPDVKSVVHCHPPHATAFGVAREPIPVCVLPEPEIFLGEVPIAPYETPGSQDFAETISPFVDSTNTIVLANHGTVSFEKDVERAYWLTEILDSYCRILIYAKQLGGVKYLPAEKGRELLKLRMEWGFDDPRSKIDAAGGGQHDLFGHSWMVSQLAQRAFPAHRGDDEALGQKAISPDLDWLIEEIAERVANRLKR